MTSIRLDLPVPPSLNNAYINVRGRGRVPSKAHTQWKRDAGWIIAAGKTRGLGWIVGPYTLTIFLPSSMRGDVSNRIKLAEDLLVDMRVTPDDRLAVGVRAERSADIAPGRCCVIVETAR
jgi:crossover junction endodeoxyribonuclease RusA